jgi:hypothetical protein
MKENMPDVQFEIIRLEDIGKDVTKASSETRPSDRRRLNHKLSDADVENLKHYLNRYNQAPPKVLAEKKSTARSVPNEARQSSTYSTHIHQHYVDITDDFYSNKSYAESKPSIEHSQPLTDIYRYHHHYRRHHQHTKHAHENTIKQTLTQPKSTLLLEYATCGMKKNTRLPIPDENFSLTNGCFGDDAGFTMERNQQNFLGRLY